MAKLKVFLKLFFDFLGMFLGDHNNDLVPVFCSPIVKYLDF